MARPSIETRPTLDEYLGPDPEAAVFAARDEIHGLVEDVRRDGGDGAALMAAIGRAIAAAGMIADRHRAAHWPMIRITAVGGPAHAITISRAGNVTMTPVLGEDRGPRFEAEVGGGLWSWCFAQRWTLEDRAAEGLRAIRAVLLALAAYSGRLEARAVARCLGAIDAALTTLRDRPPVVSRIHGLARIARELISELLRPAVLSAGGQCALFVPRP